MGIHTWRRNWHLIRGVSLLGKKDYVVLASEPNSIMSNGNDGPCISIVTVVYNGAATIEDTIKSVLSQSYPRLEYVIVDGGSTDGTVEIVRRYEKQLARWVSQSDAGIYDAMNQALEMIRGDFVLFLGCDDLLWGTDVIGNAAAKMSDQRLIYYGDVVMKGTGAVYDGVFSRWKIVRKNICHQSIFYPKELYKENKYSLKYPILADYEYNLRFFKQFSYLNLIISRFNESGVSGRVVDSAFNKDFHGLVRRCLGVIFYITVVMISIVRPSWLALGRLKAAFNDNRTGA